VSEFLSYARSREPDRREADLSALVRHVAVLLQPAAGRAGVTMDIAAEPHARAVASVDRQQVEQVLFNLTLNAIEASPRGEQVTIAVRPVKDAVTIEVLDRGPGVPPERLARIFEPFYTTKEKGTGLGLAISQRIMKAHGGRIEVGPRPGGGTVVRFELPAGDPVGGAPPVAGVDS
jgi:signal transduction histidine kinase